MPTVTPALVRERVIDVGATLGWYRHGALDPTTWMTVVGRGTTSSGDFVRATHTPDGPGTVHIQWRSTTEPTTTEPTTIDTSTIDTSSVVPGVVVRTYGPGGTWLAQRAPDMLGVGDCDDHGLEQAPHAIVADAARRRASLRLGASGDFYHELLPTVIEQRITIGEAHRQWQRLCIALGEPAPGPFARLLLPPLPQVLARRPSWWFHPLGIERKRAEPLGMIAKHAAKFWDWALLPAAQAAERLRLIGGVGQWTVGSVLGPALGDPDAVAVGDYHLKNMVGHALAGEARATDERMLELLQPYAGQRGRVVRLLALEGPGTPRFGPKHRILPMHRW